MKPLHVSSLFPALLLLAPLAAQDPIQLQAPKSGKVSFVQLGRQEQNIDAGGQQMEVVQELTHHFTIEVTGVAEDGKRTYTVVVERVHGKLDIPMAGAIEFDSASKPEEGGADEAGEDEGMGGMGLPSGEKLSAGLRELAGKSFTAEVQADGSIVGVAGFDEARKAAKKALGMAAQMMDGAISDRGLQGLVRGAIGHLPKEAVAAGASWDTKVDAGSQMPMEQSLKLTLGKIEADAVEITYAGESKMKEGARMPLPDAEVEGGKIEGKATISRKDGFTIASKQTSNMSIFGENEMVGQMTIELKLITETKRADAAKAEEKKEEPKKEEAKPAPATGK